MHEVVQACTLCHGVWLTAFAVTGRPSCTVMNVPFDRERQQINHAAMRSRSRAARANPRCPTSIHVHVIGSVPMLTLPLAKFLAMRDAILR